MATDITVSDLIVNKLTTAQYTAAKSAGTISPTESYELTDIDEVASNKAWSSLTEIPASITALSSTTTTIDAGTM